MKKWNREISVIFLTIQAAEKYLKAAIMVMNGKHAPSSWKYMRCINYIEEWQIAGIS